jgi:23S rRNA (uracil1939-C5)-methyltransferase
MGDPLLKKGDIIDLGIDSLAFGGEGIGRYKSGDQALVVFVEDVVPGDVIRARIGTKKKSFARGYVLDFIKKAPNRILPQCKHFGQCGGCALQFLAYEDQLKIKEQHVRDAIKRIGGFDEKIVLPIIGCAEPWYYRNKMEFSFSTNKEGKLGFGLHIKRMHHDLIELEECFLMNSYIGNLVKMLRDFFRENFNNDQLEAGTVLKSLVVREGKHSGEIMINLIVENGEPLFLNKFANILADFFARDNFSRDPSGKGAPEKSASAERPSDFLGERGPAGSRGKLSLAKKLTSIYFTNIQNKKGSPKLIEEKLLWGEPVIHEYLELENGNRLKFEISPQAFFQPNTKQAEVLYREALKAAGLTGKEIVFDLYCGAGTIGMFCAHAAKKVYGIELNESAVKNARANSQINSIENIEFICGDVAKTLDELKEKPNVIIIDPPRGGLDPKAVELTAAFKAERIVYVSCNPTTQARDLALLTKTGYKLLSVQPVDMFPQTYHIESIAMLSN